MTYEYNGPPSGTFAHFLGSSASLSHFFVAQAGREITHSSNTELAARLHQFSFIFLSLNIVQKCALLYRLSRLIVFAMGVANPCNSLQDPKILANKRLSELILEQHLDCLAPSALKLSNYASML
jgi:hypothetical protein